MILKLKEETNLDGFIHVSKSQSGYSIYANQNAYNQYPPIINQKTCGSCLLVVTVENGEEYVVLVKSKGFDYGLRIPGGYIDYKEIYKQAAIREMAEETGLIIDEETITELAKWSGIVRCYDEKWVNENECYIIRIQTTMNRLEKCKDNDDIEYIEVIEVDDLDSYSFFRASSFCC